MKRRGMVAGLLAALTAFGVAELVAAFVGPVGSPATAVGGAFIDRTPRWLKEFAISTFGENDKTVLLLGMALTVAALAAAIGVVALRHLRVGVAAVLALGVIPMVAAVSRPTGHDRRCGPCFDRSDCWRGMPCTADSCQRGPERLPATPLPPKRGAVASSSASLSLLASSGPPLAYSAASSARNASM